MAGFDPQSIFNIIQTIAQHGILDPKTGALHGTERTVGYVAKIHLDGELAGTVDVQEYIDYDHQDDMDSRVGYHEGVFISAIQSKDCLILPKLYSDVVIVRDMGSGREYVSMFSHIDTFHIDAHEKAVIGVAEREEFNLDDDGGADVDDLKLTGKSSSSVYAKDSITDRVLDEEGGKSVSCVMTAKSYEINVNDRSGVKFTDNDMEINVGNLSLAMSGSSVEVGGGDDQAVLGKKLVAILKDLIDAISLLTVNCSAPGSASSVPVNKLAFEAISGQLDAILSQTVKIKK